MEPLMVDFYDNPAFVHELLGRIADYNIAQVREALKYDIDAVYFGDDWGQQHGLQMGPRLWHKFILPQLKRMYAVVREAGKFVMIHSCGDVDELFDDLINVGLNCFNPFQPEVMDVFGLLPHYRGRLAFHGGLSTQKTLPFGSVENVHARSSDCWSLGARAATSLPPAHNVEGNVRWKTCWPPLSWSRASPGSSGSMRKPVTMSGIASPCWSPFPLFRSPIAWQSATPCEAAIPAAGPCPRTGIY